MGNRQKRKKLKEKKSKKDEFIVDVPKEKNKMANILKKFYDSFKEPSIPYGIPPLYGVHKINSAKMYIGDEPIGILGNAEIHGVETHHSDIYQWEERERITHDIKILEVDMLFTNPLSYRETYLGLSRFNMQGIKNMYGKIKWYEIPPGMFNKIQPEESIYLYHPTAIVRNEWIKSSSNGKLNYPETLTFEITKDVYIGGLFLYYYDNLIMFNDANRNCMAGDTLKITGINISIDDIHKDIVFGKPINPTDIQKEKEVIKLKRSIIL